MKDWCAILVLRHGVKCMKKLFACLLIIVLPFTMLTGCKKKTKAGSDIDFSNEVIAMFRYLPEGFNQADCQIYACDTIQQLYYYKKDTENKIVFEMMKDKEKDEKTICKDKEKVNIKNCKGIMYVYNDSNYIKYNLKPVTNKTIHKPDKGNIVLEWSDRRFSYRLFGTEDKSEMLKVAENISMGG